MIGSELAFLLLRHLRHNSSAAKSSVMVTTGVATPMLTFACSYNVDTRQHLDDLTRSEPDQIKTYGVRISVRPSLVEYLGM